MKRNLILLAILLVLATVTWYFYRKNSTGTLTGQPLTDFAITDTSSITKIFITDHLGRAVTLERRANEPLWSLNGNDKAKKEPVELLLKTFSRMRARSSVMQSARDNVIKLISSAGKKVEVYQGGDQPSKIYYVGNATPEHTGTYMVLEIPGIGRSPEPFIVVMDGFTGFLSTRFHADVEEWRYTGIFEYPRLEFKEVNVTFHQQPDQSYRINYGGGNDLKLLPASGSALNAFDTLAVKDYLLLYKKVHFETYNSHLSAFEEDSLLKTTPFVSIALTDNAGENKVIDLYLKKAVKAAYDEQGKYIPEDLEYFYGVLPGREVVLCQRFVFDPLIQPLAAFGVKWD
ncbi:MAG: hypothetical protein JNM00_07965 [Flavobacteriales bacterium]|nr:hypothetical protein [Flavobacteriales bacterium]